MAHSHESFAIAIVSTVRPTRGAIAVVPPELDNQICSTGFCVLQCKERVNPYYLHFVLRADSTLEQFRKFSTGSSYPAILDSDVLKTRIPSANSEEQDAIARSIVIAYIKRNQLLKSADQEFNKVRDKAIDFLKQSNCVSLQISDPVDDICGVSIEEIIKQRNNLITQTNLPEIATKISKNKTGRKQGKQNKKNQDAEQLSLNLRKKDLEK